MRFFLQNWEQFRENAGLLRFPASAQPLDKGSKCVDYQNPT
jgi:hypothetical protein